MIVEIKNNPNTILQEVMKALVYTVLICAIQVCRAQDYLYFHQEEIIKNYEDLKASDTAYVIDIRHHDSSLVVKIQGFEVITASYYFLEDNTCYYIVLEYECRECFETHLSEFLETKKMKWKQIGNDYYLSSWGMKRTLKITRNHADVVGIIELKAVNTRAEYAKLKQLCTEVRRGKVRVSN